MMGSTSVYVCSQSGRMQSIKREALNIAEEKFCGGNGRVDAIHYLYLNINILLT